MPTVAVTGASGYLGRKLVERLAEEESVGRVVGIDQREPGFAARNLEFYKLDVRARELGDALAGCDVLVHLAASRSRDLDEMRDVNVGGTRMVLEAATRVGVGKVIFTSTTMVYGAHPDNDFPLTEDSALRPVRDFPYSWHKAEAEQVVQAFADGHPDTSVCIFRACQIAGPAVSGSRARRLESPYAVAVEGYDPPVQAVHEDDAARALSLAVSTDLRGVYNLCPQGWISSERAAGIVGQRRFVLTRRRAERLLERLWTIGLGTFTPGYLPFLMYPCVASNERLTRTGFEFRHTTEDALRTGAEARRDWVSLGRVRFRPRRVAMTVGSLGAVAIGSAARNRVQARHVKRERT